MHEKYQVMTLPPFLWKKSLDSSCYVSNLSKCLFVYTYVSQISIVFSTYLASESIFT